MNYKTPKPEVVTWQGLELNVKRVSRQLAILSVDTREESYSHAVDKITELNLWAVERLSRLPLRQFDRQKPCFACAVIPQADFLESTGIPANYSWAQICSRSLWREGREDLVVASSRYADSIDFDPNTRLEELDEERINLL